MQLMALSQRQQCRALAIVSEFPAAGGASPGTNWRIRSISDR
jgi:hypothetical protein